MDRTFYANTLREYLVALGVAFGILLLVAAIRALVRRKFAQAGDTPTPFDDFVLHMARKTKLVLLAIPAIYLGARALSLPPDLWRFIQKTATLSLIAQSALWGAGVVDFWLKRYRSQKAEVEPDAVTTVNAFRFAAVAAIWIVAVLSAIANLGFDITALVAGLGVGGVAVALATQNILGDLFASLSIILDKPFVLGDFIIVGESMGTVEKIGLKTTRLRSLSGEQLVLSNGDLLKSRIRNYKRMWERRIVFRIGVVYQTSAAQLERIPQMIREVIERQEHTRVDRIHFMTFADSALEFEIVYYVLVPEYNAYAETQHAINLGIVRAFETEGIEFAYPTRTLYMQS
ncbi:MAG TPA: mechanosensitive ion channel family protein [Thermoanaerobaculia bacterium]|nr:mechanosensitive ion channel family protein [Thermoanaerobaculia bacterium]